MRPLVFFLGLIVLCTPFCARAGVQPVTIIPHVAIYDMALASVKNGSDITDASGRMMFAWRDVCDGWAVEQHMKLHFSYSDDNDQDITSSELSWEAKNGKAYTFNVRRITNGAETERYRGKAVQNPDGSVTVTYSLPKEKTEHLPAGTLFPSAHTMLILAKAAQGEKFFTRRVFDGSDAVGQSDISAFILPPQPVSAAGLPEKMRKNPLLAAPAWPVHMAFFDPTQQTEEPDYEMDLDLVPNGVARHMKIDYGDFAVTGTLQALKPLPPVKCP